MTLKAVVRTYIRHVRARALTELDWFRQQPSLRLAIEKAALAVNRQGKRHSHHRRRKKATLERARRVLLANSKAIKQVRNFDDLIKLIDCILEPIRDIGPLYVYDTSLHIGAKLNLLPTKVYLHAGTRIGARALGFDSSAPALERFAFPQEFRPLEPHEIEDALCMFKTSSRQVDPSGLPKT